MGQSLYTSVSVDMAPLPRLQMIFYRDFDPIRNSGVSGRIAERMV
jgi:hypothetical protein